MKQLVLAFALTFVTAEAFAQRRPGPGPGRRPGPSRPGPGRWNPTPGPGRWNPRPMPRPVPRVSYCRVNMIDNWHATYRTYRGECWSAMNQCNRDLRFNRRGLRCVYANGNW